MGYAFVCQSANVEPRRATTSAMDELTKKLNIISKLTKRFTISAPVLEFGKLRDHTGKILTNFNVHACVSVNVVE